MGLRASTISNFHDLIELLQRDSRSSPAQPRRLAFSRAQVENRHKSVRPPMLGSLQAACSAGSFLECRPSPATGSLMPIASDLGISQQLSVSTSLPDL